MHHFKTLAIVILSLVSIASKSSLTLRADEPQKIAFVVGVSKYEKDGLSDLKYAEFDAAELGTALKRSQFKTTVLLGEKATGSAINAELKKFFAVAKTLKKSDVVLLSFSGHGLQLMVNDGDRQVETPFFCPSDALKTDASTLISFNSVMQQIKTESASSQNLMIVDACRDNPAKGAKGVDGSSVTELPNKLSVLFGSSAGTRSYESEKVKHGIFTYYLLKGLRGAAAKKNDQVTWLNLASYVMDNVRDESPKLLDDATLIQKPNLLGNLVDHPVLGNASHFSMQMSKEWNEVSPKSKEWLNIPDQMLQWTKPGIGYVLVNTAVDHTSPEITRDQLLEQYPKGFKNWKKTEVKIYKVAGHPTLKLAATFDAEGVTGVTKLAQIQYYIHANNEKYYIATFSCHADKLKDFQKDFDEAVESIQID